MQRYADAFREAGLALDIGNRNDALRLQADALLLSGKTHRALGRSPEARRALERAREIFALLQLADHESDALHELATLERAAGRLEPAIALGRQAIERSESLRTNLAHPELRATYSAARRTLYEYQIDLLMQAYQDTANEQYLAAAVELAERSRARLTAELIAEGTAKFADAVEPSQLDRQARLYERLAELKFRRDNYLRKRSGISPDLQRILADLADTETELDVLETQFRANHAGPIGLEKIEALSTSEIQRRLEPDTAVLLYQLAEPRSFAWLVSRDSIGWAILPGRETVEAAVDAVTDSLYRYAASSQTRRQDAEKRRQLADILLAPLAAWLKQERLLIVADGLIEYVPFAVLPMPTSDGKPELLIERSEIIVVPSVTVGFALRERHSPIGANGTFAIFADPIFGHDDARVAAGAPDDDVDAESATSGRRAAAALSRLPYTMKEVEIIERLVPAERRLVASGFGASRETFLATDFSGIDVLHLATHGLIDPRYPELSALVLSQVDERGRAQDGFVRLLDVYGLNLNARLVVLSACETALGRHIRGEGLIGFTQGFLSAGASNLLTSLWRVPDRATAEIMQRFYAHLVGDGLPPAAALRQAQLDLAAERRWRDPYFWGAFIVIGSPD